MAEEEPALVVAKRGELAKSLLRGGDLAVDIVRVEAGVEP